MLILNFDFYNFKKVKIATDKMSTIHIYNVYNAVLNNIDISTPICTW